VEEEVFGVYDNDGERAEIKGVKTSHREVKGYAKGNIQTWSGTQYGKAHN
jgi:hypothetical protein